MLFQCNNDECYERTNTGPVIFIFEDKLPICPKCNSGPPTVGTASLVHFAYRNKNGKLKGHNGRGITIACGKVNGADPNNCMTPLPYLVNCLQCKNSEDYKKYWFPNPDDINSWSENPNLTEEDKNRITEMRK